MNTGRSDKFPIIPAFIVYNNNDEKFLVAIRGKLIFFFRKDSDGTSDNDSNNFCDDELSNNFGIHFQLRTHSITSVGWLINCGRGVMLRS